MGFFSRKASKGNSKNQADAVGVSDGNYDNNNEALVSSGEVAVAATISAAADAVGSVDPLDINRSSSHQKPVCYPINPSGDGSDYVNADLITPVPKHDENATREGKNGPDVTTIDNEGWMPSKKDNFDGIRGVVQPPKYKDLKYFFLFVVHFCVTIWLVVDSFIPTYTYNNNIRYSNVDMNHFPLVSVVLVTTLMGLFISLLAVGYFLRHGQTLLKSTIFFSITICLSVGVLGLLLGEMFMCLAGWLAFSILSLYANFVWKRIPFTAINLSMAISSIRDNMGLILAALQVCGIGCIWIIFAAIACINAYKSYGSWTLLYFVFSFYWTQQIFSNVVSVATAGNIGRWFVVGESCPNLNTGLKDMLTRARTYSFGSVCIESLVYGIQQIVQGFSTFLSSLNIPFLPNILNGFTWCISQISSINEWSFVYIGLYGYSHKSADRNITTLFKNNGMDVILQEKYAGNVLFMSNMTIGLLTGVFGMIFATFGYKLWRRAGMPNPVSDGFFVGFIVGFLQASIILSVVTATMKTLIVCYAENPTEFEANHPELSARMERAWDIGCHDDPKQESKDETKLVAFSEKGRTLTHVIV